MNSATPADSSPGLADVPGWPQANVGAASLKNQPSLPYKLALGLVAITMLLLPVIYIALTGLAGYGVYHFATHGFQSMMAYETGSGRLDAIKFFLACLPIVVGSLVVIFMVKPLFAGPIEGMSPIRLLPQAEPRLFAFIERLCQTVGAPVPVRVEIDCDLNASASFHRGLRSFLGHELVLTIGLPLVAGLSAREFAGVLAHEFGHFTQGAGMRASYLIRKVNFWLVRSIYERDSWDDALDSVLWSGNKWLMVLGLCSRIGIWVSRLVLRLLLFIGNVVSGLLLRQMEYDADSYEIRLAGSAAFESTMSKLHTLGEVYTDNTMGIQGARMMDWQFQMPDDFPELIARCEEQLPPHARERILTKAAEEKTGLIDSHPAYRDRVSRAKEANDPGIFSSEEPARNLIANFDALCRCVTMAHYQSDWKVPVSEENLIPVSHFIAYRAATAASGGALAQYGAR